MNFNDKKKLGIILSVMIFIAGLLAAFNIEEGYFIGGDASLYIEQAQHLITGKTTELFEENKYSMDHSDRVIGPYLYPSGFAVLLTPVYALFGLNFKIFKIYMLIFHMITIFAMWKLFRDKFADPVYLVILVGCYATNYILLNFADYIYADTAYMLFALLSILTIEKLHKSSNFFAQAFIGLIIGFSYNIKPAGILLLFTLAIFQLFNDVATLKPSYFRQNLPKFVPYIIFFLWNFFVDLIYINGSLNHYGLLNTVTFQSLASNLVYYFLEFRMFFIHFYPKPGLALFILIILTAMAGMFIYRKIYTLYIIFMILNLFLYTLWPAKQGVRFLFPVFPFIIFFSIKGILFLSDKFSIKQIRFIPQAILLLITVQGIFYSIRELSTDNSTNVLSPPAIEAFNFIRESAEEDELIVFFKPRIMRLMTNRNSISLSNPEKICSSGAAYYVTFREKIAAYPNFRLRLENKDFKIYEIQDHSQFRK